MLEKNPYDQVFNQIVKSLIGSLVVEMQSSNQEKLDWWFGNRRGRCCWYSHG